MLSGPYCYSSMSMALDGPQVETTWATQSSQFAAFYRVER